MVELLVVKDLIQFFQQLPQQEVEQVCLGVHLLQEPVCQEDPVAELLLELVVQEDLETLLLYPHHKELTVVDRAHIQAATEAGAEAHQDQLALEIHNT